jgi:hypothetical protein
VRVNVLRRPAAGDHLRLKVEHAHPDTGSLLTDVVQTYARVFAAWRNKGRIFAFIIAEAQQDEAVAEALATFREERIEAWKLVLHADPGSPFRAD